MAEARYNNRQIEKMFEEQNELRDSQTKELKEHFALVINPLTEQVKKTNGSVTALNKWKERMSGAVGVILFILPFMLGAVGWLFHQVNSIDDRIEQALNDYQIDVNVSE